MSLFSSYKKYMSLWNTTKPQNPKTPNNWIVKDYEIQNVYKYKSLSDENHVSCSQSWTIKGSRIWLFWWGILTLGYVFEAYDHDWRVKVALKRTTKAGEYVSREYEILEMLKDCKNCVKVLDIFYTKTDEGKMA